MKFEEFVSKLEIYKYSNIESDGDWDDDKLKNNNNDTKVSKMHKMSIELC